MDYSSATRPVTSKSRGICRYYNQSRGCFAGNRCKFLHGQPPELSASWEGQLLTPYDKSKRCRYFDAGFCKRGASCWFVHKADLKGKALDDEEDELCSICFEKPFTYGLLEGCSHIFCIDCIKRWRDVSNRPGEVVGPGNTKKCPMCRAASKFITPSSRFFKGGTEEKANVVRAYKESMAKVLCRYFQQSLQKNANRPHCQYGNECFYQHVMPDGTRYVFKDQAIWRRYGDILDAIRFFPSLDMGFNSTLEPPYVGESYPGEGTNDPHQTETDQSVARRMDQNLELLNNSIPQGATLENLRRVFASLQDATGSTGAGSTLDSHDGPEARELRGRLETLANQLLQSANVLLMNAAEHRDEDEDGSASDTGDLPGLQSVSDSSEYASDGEESATSPAGDPPLMPWLETSDLEAVYLDAVAGPEELPAAATPPPFVTDGRGRVVWSSADDEDGDSAADAATDTDSSSRGGLFGWINSLF